MVFVRTAASRGTATIFTVPSAEKNEKIGRGRLVEEVA